MPLLDQVEQARQHGYSDYEIYEYLGNKAKKYGHKEEDVKDYLKQKINLAPETIIPPTPKPNKLKQLFSPVKEIARRLETDLGKAWNAYQYVERLPTETVEGLMGTTFQEVAENLERGSRERLIEIYKKKGKGIPSHLLAETPEFKANVEMARSLMTLPLSPTVWAASVLGYLGRIKKITPILKTVDKNLTTAIKDVAQIVAIPPPIKLTIPKKTVVLAQWKETTYVPRSVVEEETTFVRGKGMKQALGARPDTSEEIAETIADMRMGATHPDLIKKIGAELGWTKEKIARAIRQYRMPSKKQEKAIREAAKRFTVGVTPESIKLTPEETIFTQIVDRIQLSKLKKQMRTRKPPMKTRTAGEFPELSRSRQAYELMRKDISNLEAVKISEEDALADMGRVGNLSDYAKSLRGQGKYAKDIFPQVKLGKPPIPPTPSREVIPPTPPPPTPPPTGAAEMGPQDPIQKVINALKEAKPIRGKQERFYTEERGQRLARALAVGQKVKGEKGYYVELSQLKGKLEKVQFDSIRAKLTQDDIDALFINVKNSPLLTDWDKFTARKGLAKLFGEYGGTVPTEGELSLLDRVFGGEFIKAVMGKRSLLAKMRTAGYQLANIPRSIMSSFDFSAPLRQGIFFIGRPKQFFGAFRKMFGQFGRERIFQAAQEEIIRRPTYDLMVKGRLALTEMGRFLGKREERFMAQWGERIPIVGRGVRASGRAYTGFLNKLRADVFDDLIGKADKLGLNPKANMDLVKQIANFINVGTGRGSLGNLERAAVSLNSFFFSPRLVASRLTLLNPVYYVNLDPFVRKEALKSLFTFAGVGLTTLGLAKAAGAEVGTDLRSTDFGKIKIGNIRIDPWGGFQQYIVTACRVISGQVVSSTTERLTELGKGYRPLTRLDIIERAIEYKQAPVFSFVTGLLKGQGYEGKPLSIPSEIGKRFVPMAIGDIYDIMNEDPGLLPVGILGIFGVGLQTYKQRPSKFSFQKGMRTPVGLKLRK
jgi:hypothetical protein